MRTSLLGLRRPSRTLLLGLALLLVSALFFLIASPTLGDSPLQGDKDHPLYTNPSRAALAEAIAKVDSRSEEADSLTFTPCVDGMADVYPCDKVDLLAFMSLNDIGGSNTNDIWGWTDPQDGKEYALVGRTNGTSFVDISNPEAPLYLGQLPGHNGSSSSWRDVKVYSDHAFIVSEASGHGMQIFDLALLRNVTNPPVTFSETAHYAGFGNAHNIVINEDSGYAYAVGSNTCSAGLDMVNISDPLNPTAAGCFSQDGYTHDAQCVNYMGLDLDYIDSEICLNSNEDTLTIADVTDKANPVQVARVGYPNPGYTHQGWLTDDQRYFLQNDETDETSQGINTRTLIWDLVDLDNPIFMGTFDSGLPASDHNLYIRGNYAYQSNYASGLRILDISDIGNANLETVAYFDVWPSSDAAGFDGSWSNYPYFESGNIIVTSRALGFMIVRATLEADFSLSASPTSQDVCVPDDAIYTVNVHQSEDFSENVNLSVSGEPAGAIVDFSINDMVPPFTSALTIGTLPSVANNAGPTVGSYEIDIIGMASISSHTTTVSLNLADTVPGDVTLMTPADGATDVSRSPTFSWMAVDGASSYQLEVATDTGFSNVVIDVAVEDTSYEAESSLDSLTTYYWRVTAINGCGSGTASATWSFTTQDVPPILVVDDQNGASNELSAYTDALDALGEDYDVFDTAANGNVDPTAEQMAPYLKVIWLTGSDFSSDAGPNPTGEAELGDYLDENADRCLFISGQDYLWGQGGGSAGNPTAFMMAYLGLASTDTDVGHAAVSGSGAFALLGPYTLAYPFTNYSDELNPDGTADVAFTGDGAGGSNAAISKVTDNYRTTYWGFPFEAIPSAGEREETMQTVLDWCTGIELATGTLEGTITDADSGDGIEGATVTADDGTETTTDENGDYNMSLLSGTYTVMAEADNYASEMVADITVMTDTTTTLDFMLAGSQLTYSPDMIEENMEIGDVVTNTVTLTNSGPLDIEFSLDIDNFASPGIEIVSLTVEPLEAPSAQEPNNNKLANLFAASNSGKSIQSQPSIAGGDVELVLDDGSSDNSIGVGGGQFVWLNRFTPDQYPFNLTEVQILFGNSGVDVGELVDIYVYEDTDGDGDPATNAMHLASINSAEVQANDSSTWSVYELDIPVMLDGPGDVLIAVVNRTAGINDGEFPAEIDQTASQQRSWTGIYTTTPTSPPTFPADGAWGIIDDLNADLAGNWMIRGYGQTGNVMDSWATVMPDGGTIPANSSVTIEVVFDARELFELGDYTADISFSGTFVNDLAAMPLTMHLSCASCGTLNGSITDADSGDGIEGATVTADDGTETTTDENGDYNMSLLSGTYAVMAEADNYASEMVADVTVMTDTTTTLDFMLAGSQLTYSPDMIEESMEIGDVVTNTVTLTNSGPLDIEFSLDINNFASPGIEIVSLTIEPNEAPAAQSTNSNLANLFVAANSPKSIQSQPSIAGGDVELILDDGSSDNAIGVGGGQFVWLNRFTPDQYPFNLTEVQILFGNSGVDVGELVDIYVYEDTDGDGDPGTNAMHLASINNAEVQANDSSTWSVYELDTPVMLNGPGDVLIAVVNRTAGINAGEFPAEIDQAASQQRSWTGIYTTTPTSPPTFPADGTWGIIDDLAANLAGNWMIRGYGQTGNVIGPWATVMPDSGMIPANSSVTIEVVFDARDLFEPGDYTADISFSGTFVNDVAAMPLTMHLSCASCGTLNGSITDALTGAPLIANINVTGEDGYDVTVTGDSYDLTVLPGSYNITVSANAYFSQSTSVTVSAGQTVTTDFALVALPTPTPTNTPTATNTPTYTPTPSNTPTYTPTVTQSNTPTATNTPGGPTNTPTSTITSTPTNSPTPIATDVPAVELLCNGAMVGFEGGIPSNWATSVTEGSVYWSTTADSTACNGTNQTGGSGIAACADSDETNRPPSEPYDTEMWTPAFSLSDVPTATLQFAAAYRDINPSGGDHFEVDVWDGSAFHNALNWNEEHRNPGELVEIDLNAYAGQSDVKVRFRYYGNGWDWWSQVDDVQLSCGQLTEEASIRLEKTVGTDPGVCAASDSVTLGTGGGEVTYCYKVINTSNITFDLHDLVDDQLGQLLSNESQALAPAASFTHLETTTITTDTINSATWTAHSEGTSASASDSAVVRIEALCGATIQSVSSGDWDDSNTWDLNRVPNGSDIVLIQEGNLVDGSAVAHVQGFCNYGTLQSPDGESLKLTSTTFFKNYGQILGLEGEAGSGNSCGTIGSSLDLRGKPFHNEGTIQAGDGGDGERCGGAGGTARIMGHNSSNSGLIAAGSGGDVTTTGSRAALDHPRELQGTYVGGRGGDTHVRGNFGGSGFVDNSGTLQAGDGGNGHPSAALPQSGGNGGCLYIYASSLSLTGNQWAGLGGEGTAGAPDGMDGCVSIDPSLIDFSGPNTSVRGGNIEIFGGDDWVLDLSGMSEGAISASGDLMLAVGEGGSVDLRDNQSQVLQVAGEVTIASDEIELSEETSLDEVIQAAKVQTQAHQILVEFDIDGPERLLIEPSSKQMLSLIILNNGPMTDTYTLSLSDPDGWTQGSLPSSITIAGLETADLEESLMVVPPAGAANGDMTTLTLRATSQSDPTAPVAELEVEVVVEGGGFFLHLPLISNN